MGTSLKKLLNIKDSSTNKGKTLFINSKMLREGNIKKN